MREDSALSYPRAMADLSDGESVEVKGSGSAVYTLRNVGGAYSCSCPAWLHQSSPAERRTCKHLRRLRGDEAERARLGTAELAGKPKRASTSTSGDESDDEGPPLLLAHKWEPEVDLTGWWMSEKLDGVRAYWDGTQFLSRLGNRFLAPEWFTEALPDTPLDGELWGGRKLFQRTVGIVKRQDAGKGWKTLSFVVFDAPSHGGVFEERIEHLTRSVSRIGASHLRALEHELCRGPDHLREELLRVESLGGEGLMLRRPGSKYEVGRSHTLLKVKSFHDAEARVVGHVAGAGRHEGRLGALVLELPDGTRFNAGTGLSDREREDPPALGAVVTFRYQELSNTGVPRFPTYVGVRIDARLPKVMPAPAEAPAALPAKTLPAKNARAKTASAKTERAAETRPSDATEASGSTRRFELVDGASSKFWEISLAGASFTARYGRIGSSGQSTTKHFDTEEMAAAAHDKLVAEKTKKGYVET